MAKAAPAASAPAPRAASSSAPAPKMSTGGKSGVKF